MGQFAIQLAALSGYKIVTTASPKNFELVKSLGASEVFDYRDPEVVSKIKSATKDSIRIAFDTISLRDSQGISAEVIAPSGGKVLHILGVIPDATARKDVARECKFYISHRRTGAYIVICRYHHLFRLRTRIYVRDWRPRTCSARGQGETR